MLKRFAKEPQALRYLEKEAAVGHSPGMMDVTTVMVTQAHDQEQETTLFRDRSHSQQSHRTIWAFHCTAREASDSRGCAGVWLPSRVSWRLAMSIPRNVSRGLHEADDHEPSVFVQEMWDVGLPVLKQAGIVPPRLAKRA